LGLPLIVAARNHKQLDPITEANLGQNYSLLSFWRMLTNGRLLNTLIRWRNQSILMVFSVKKQGHGLVYNNNI
jgi:hypothetical protein